MTVVYAPKIGHVASEAEEIRRMTMVLRIRLGDAEYARIAPRASHLQVLARLSNRCEDRAEAGHSPSGCTDAQRNAFGAEDLRECERKVK